MHTFVVVLPENFPFLCTSLTCTYMKRMAFIIFNPKSIMCVWVCVLYNIHCIQLTVNNNHKHIWMYVCNFYMIIIIKLFPNFYVKREISRGRESGPFYWLKCVLTQKFWWVILQIRSENPIQSIQIHLLIHFAFSWKIISGNHLATYRFELRFEGFFWLKSKPTTPTAKCVNVNVILWHTIIYLSLFIFLFAFLFFISSSFFSWLLLMHISINVS